MTNAQRLEVIKPRNRLDWTAESPTPSLIVPKVFTVEDGQWSVCGRGRNHGFQSLKG